MIINPLIPRVVFAGVWIAIHSAFCLLANQGSDAISDGISPKFAYRNVINGHTCLA
jgi:hypothetical protein